MKISDTKAKSVKTDNQTSNQRNNVGSRDDAQPRTNKKMNAHVHVNSSASDVDTQTSSKETKNCGILKQSASAYGD